MERIKKTDNTNIPNSILVKGVSHDDFVKLLKELKSIIIDEGIHDINNYNKLFESISKVDPNGSEEWKDNFTKQVEKSTKIIESEYEKIEEMFNRLFDDWNEYQKQHVSVLEEAGDTDE